MSKRVKMLDVDYQLFKLDNGISILLIPTVDIPVSSGRRRRRRSSSNDLPVHVCFYSSPASLVRRT